MIKTSKNNILTKSNNIYNNIVWDYYSNLSLSCKISISDEIYLTYKIYDSSEDRLKSIICGIS